MSEFLCKDCKHSFRPINNLLLFGFKSRHAYKCRLSFNESAPDPDPVIGMQLKPAHYESCSVARMEYLSASKKGSNCGPEAQWWQPKDKRNLFKLILKQNG